ncbi:MULTISPECIES: ClbS/DfsB family four-helix bundle protein [Agrobacterium]|jgi:hypothetical protein|uniref:ClbS/DfsB family four-helix bundle protein n=3 Tax=Agrobacterium tumefaciens complex TaxID=1183400 RepID=A0A822V560_AGRTU|nr:MULTISPECIES: ClbS/DfsB family four-helix bundle protein [Agrobacterium tumefaciens complex]MCP2135194.1 hypothetical protein [Rhizobium sp. SLBN-94]TGE82391.1 ClbS/DfsB family four-helix bundle protein [Rhizobium sp. SEMIA 439]AYM04966.1 hypothetical protein At1D1460_07240 [Agrobacterium tumefaciens]EPR19121.1 hypothetical protein L902_33730 [Agrobacterium radiobacter DSM 30147]KAA1236529.1 ClbS/DfsB family four-helix bundle protein [Agrobacterium tumefaciens]
MAVPESATELRTAIESSFEKLMRELETVPVDLAGTRDMDGHAAGTLMSVNDLVAYLIGWGELVLKWISLRAEGREPDFPETGYKWNALGALAQKFYGDYVSLSFAERQERLDSVKRRIIDAINAYDPHQLYAPGWYGKWSLGRMIQFNTSSPYVNARGRLRKWKKARGIA